MSKRVPHREVKMAYSFDRMARQKMAQAYQVLVKQKVENLAKFALEPYGPHRKEQGAFVLVAPNYFDFGGLPGEMNTWENFGQFYSKINANRDILPELAKTEIDKIISQESTIVGKVEMLYKYLQNNTRYVGVQLGVGGFQTFDAKYVFEKKYGDCKALTNYMQSMLKYAGIQSYPALVLAGRSEPDILKDFSANQFNHVILCVPAKNDTIWLECTSQTSPFGHLGTFTEDRHVLVVTPIGGVICKTPASNANDNMQIRRAEVEILENGDAAIKIEITYTGNQQDRVRGYLMNKSPRDREKWLRNQYSYNIVENHVDYSDLEKSNIQIKLPIVLKIRKLGSRSNTRLFFKPALEVAYQSIPSEVEDRKQPLDFVYPFNDQDLIQYKLPPGYEVENMPEAIDITTDFGIYRTKYIDDGKGKLTFHRTFIINERRMDASYYDLFRQFVKQVIKGDKGMVVLVKKQSAQK